MKYKQNTPRIRRCGMAGLMVVISTIFVSPLEAVPPGAEPALGPLGGRNLYAPHLPWFSFPAEKAAAMEEGSLILRSGFYFLNEFVSKPFILSDYDLVNNRLKPEDQEELISLDYESTVWEIGVDWQATESFRLSSDWRLHFRYGGFMDSIFEWWHSVFGLPNSHREYFDRNRSRWKIVSSQVGSFLGGSNIIASGDLNVRLVWTLIDNSQFALAAQAAIKLPLGTGNFGSGYPDIAVAMALDWHPWRRWSFYANGGLIFPTDLRVRVMGQFIPAVEFRLLKDLSLLVQMNIQSPPITSNEYGYIHPILGFVNAFSLPQTNLKIGLKGREGRFYWQAYFEEEPFTWEGPDFLLYCGVGWTVKAG